MARQLARPAARHYQLLTPLRDDCPGGGQRLWVACHSTRVVMTLDGSGQFTLVVRRCRRRDCPRSRRAHRPEAEGASALPKGAIGLDGSVLIGPSRCTQRRRVPEIHRARLARGVTIAQRSVTNRLYRYEELVALPLADRARLGDRLAEQGQIILAIAGRQPDVGHEVLWVRRDCLSGEIPLARSLVSGREAELVPLLRAAAAAAPAPIHGGISRPAVDPAGDRGGFAGRAPSGGSVPLPPGSGPAGLRSGSPRPEGAQEAGARRAADRAGAGGAPRGRGRGHARLLPRGAQRPDRRRLAPLLHRRATAPGAAGDHPRLPRASGGAKGGLPRELAPLARLLSRGLTATAALWPDLRTAYGWVHRAAHLLANPEAREADGGRAAYTTLLTEMARQRERAGTLAPAVDHCLKVTRSFAPGLFHCCAVDGLPRTPNELAQTCGAARVHERRTTGRKTASPALVVRGSVRRVAAVATRQQSSSPRALRPRTWPAGGPSGTSWTTAMPPAAPSCASAAVPPATSPPWRPSCSSPVCRRRFFAHSGRGARHFPPPILFEAHHTWWTWWRRGSSSPLPSRWERGQG